MLKFVVGVGLHLCLNFGLGLYLHLMGLDSELNLALVLASDLILDYVSVFRVIGFKFRIKVGSSFIFRYWL